MFPLACIRQSPTPQGFGFSHGHSGKAARIICEGIEGLDFLPPHLWIMFELDENATKLYLHARKEPFLWRNDEKLEQNSNKTCI